MVTHKKIIEDVRGYYTEKIKGHGATPLGVDWNSAESQDLRFEQLAKVIDPDAGFFSIVDFGCGYGALVDFLKARRNGFEYTGFDISEKMIAEAAKKNPGTDAVRWVTDESSLAPVDYVVASGLFNVRLSHADDAWQQYIVDTLTSMNRLAQKGFAFNMLTSYSDKDHMKEYLYYADPAYYFDYCKTRFSKYVGLLHDYPLYEFTLLVKK